MACHVGSDTVLPERHKIPPALIARPPTAARSASYLPRITTGRASLCCLPTKGIRPFTCRPTYPPHVVHRRLHLIGVSTRRSSSREFTPCSSPHPPLSPPLSLASSAAREQSCLTVPCNLLFRTSSCPRLPPLPQQYLLKAFTIP